MEKKIIILFMVPAEFLRKDKIKAIVKIHNLKTDELYLLKSSDAVKSFKDERFKLDLGMHPNKALQRAYSELGLELFTIEIDAEAEKEEELDELLKKRTNYYLSLGFKLYA